MGAQQRGLPVRPSRNGGDIKSVLGVAGRMVGGGVQGVKAVILILDLRPFSHGKAELAEGADDVLGDLREGMKFAERPAAARQREIRGLSRQGGGEFQLFAAGGESGLDLDLGEIDELSRGGLFLFGQRAELLHQSGEPAAGAQPGALGLLERGEVGGRSQFRDGV